MPDRTQLSPSATEALETVRERIERADGLTQEEVVTLLIDAEVERSDAGTIVGELLSKGYLYEVDDSLYVTPS